MRTPLQIYVCGPGMKPLELQSCRYLSQKPQTPYSCTIYLNNAEMTRLLYNQSNGLNSSGEIRRVLEEYLTDGLSLSVDGEMQPGTLLRTYIAKALRPCISEIFGNPRRPGAINLHRVIEDLAPGGPIFDHMFDVSFACKEIERDLFCVYESNRYLGNGEHYAPVTGDQLLLQSQFTGTAGTSSFELRFIYDKNCRSTSERVSLLA